MFLSKTIIKIFNYGQPNVPIIMINNWSTSFYVKVYKGYKNQCDETIFSALNASRQFNEILLFLCIQTY